MNRIRCIRCKDIIESLYRHDFKYCACGAVFVDGGEVYQRVGGDLECIEVWVSGKFIPLKELESDIEFNDCGGGI